MKHFYSTVLIFFFISAQAQVVNIPDSNFKNVLMNVVCANLSQDSQVPNTDVDANNDGEIQESEAAAVITLWINGGEIANLQGLEYFVNLKNCRIYNNLITTFTGAGLDNLKQLLLIDNQLTSISNLPSTLQWFSCSGNQLTSLDVSYLPDLILLSCGDNQLATLYLNSTVSNMSCNNNLLTSIDFKAHHYDLLNCSHNLLTSVDFTGTTVEGNFDISYNQLSTVAFPPGSVYNVNISGNLYTSIELPSGFVGDLICNDTQLTELDLSQVYQDPDWIDNNGGPFQINNNANLQYINLKNGVFDFCVSDPVFPDECNPTTISGNPQLHFICVDEGTEAFGVTETAYLLAENIDSGVTITPYCIFTPGGQYNTITGNLRFDFDGNGCTASDTAAPRVEIAFAADSTISGKTYTNNLGDYTSYSGLTQTLTPQFENPYYTVSPASHVATFTGFGNAATADFCITPNGVHPDLKITLIPITPARPGFDATYKIHYQNKGTESQSGTVSLAFEDDVLDLVSANPAVSLQSANLLSWNFSNLIPFESREITLTLNVNSPMETPAVNNGDILDFTASAVSGTDETPADNTFAYSQMVVGSLDPNDKSVSRETIGISQLGDYLYYTVRFQNTGTFAAENVVVKDMLPGNLDLSTLQMVSASHPYRSTLTMGNKLEFFFEGINLPASADNEPDSHGYVIFKIKPMQNLVLNDVITNKAEIYFDFNFPIVTNTVTTTLTSLGVNNFNRVVTSLYPNPVKNNFTVELTENDSFKNIVVYNTLGQVVKTVKITNQENRITVDSSDLQSGSYIVSIETNTGKTRKKLMKL